MKRKTKLQTGVFALVLVGVVGFYQYRLREYTNMTSVECWQLKKGITVIKGQELKSNMFHLVKRDKDSIPDDYLKNLDDISNKLALDNFYEEDILRSKRVVDKSKWYSENERIVWLNAKQDQIIAGNDLRPGDKVDIFVYDPSLKQYYTEKNFQGIEVIDLKDKDGIKYFDSKNTAFVNSLVCFKMDNSIYNTLANKIKESDNDFKITIHGNRPDDARVMKDDNSIVQSLSK